MNVYLLYPDKDYHFREMENEFDKDLVQDLKLRNIFSMMAGEDKYLYKTVSDVILAGLNDPMDVRYRQDILSDSIKHSEIIREIYQIACHASESSKGKYIGIFKDYPSHVLNGSVKSLEDYIPYLEKISILASKSANIFVSEGLRRFCEMIQQELSTEYLFEMKNYVKELKFSKGIHVSAQIGSNLIPETYILHKMKERKKGLRGLFQKNKDSRHFVIHERDESGFRILAELQDKILADTAIIISFAEEHIRSFFQQMKLELSFYIACLNMWDIFLQEEIPLTIPLISETPDEIRFRKLFYINETVGLIKSFNPYDIDISGKNTCFLSGANQGGKSTFLISIGQSLVLMRCGMFVPAEYFSAPIKKVFTHFKREEDENMKNGKFEEEMTRMSRIIDVIHRDSLLLLNDSFESTNETEGSEIAAQIIKALSRNGISIFYVTHFYSLLNNFYQNRKEDSIFMTCSRETDGRKDFQMKEGIPESTGYSKDIYYDIFCDSKS